MIIWPSTEDFKNYIKDGLIKICNITIDDINREEAIYGTPTPILKGKMKITTPHFFTKHPRIPLPL